MILTEDDHDQMTASSKSRAANLHFSSKSIKMLEGLGANHPRRQVDDAQDEQYVF